MSWRDRIERLRGEAGGAAIPATPATRSSESGQGGAAIPATPATRPPRVAEVAEVAATRPPNLQDRETCPSSRSSGSSSDPAADLDTIDLELEAADLIRRSGVEGLTVADLDLDTLLNVTHFAKLGSAARPGLKVWFKALAAAKRSSGGLGIASAPADRGHLVAVARRGAWSRLLTIEQKVDSLTLVKQLVELGQG